MRKNYFCNADITTILGYYHKQESKNNMQESLTVANTLDQTPDQSPPLVIVVDDDPSMRLMLQHILEKEQYQVLEAANGLETLSLCHANSPNLVLLDAIMPEMDGFITCKNLKEKYPELPVIIITSLDDDQSVERAFQAGADDYLTKPINWSVLKHRVSQTFLNEQRNRQRHIESALEQRIRNHDYHMELQPRIHLETEAISCLEAEFYESNSSLAPLIQDYPNLAPLSIIAMENLLNYACTHFEIVQTRNDVTCCLAVPLLPCNAQPQDFVDMFKRVTSKTTLSLEHIEFYVDANLLEDRQMLDTLEMVSALPNSISISNFSFSLNTLAFLNQVSCQSIRLNIETLHKARVASEPEWLVHMLSPYTKQKLYFFAENISSENDLALAKQVGCTEATGSYIKHIYALNT